MKAIIEVSKRGSAIRSARAQHAASRRGPRSGFAVLGQRRQAKPDAGQLGQHAAGCIFLWLVKVSCSGGTLHFFSLPAALLPNPSLKRSANGRPPGPVWRYAVHFRQPGPGVLPSSPA